ncbi:hypothetical protein DFQ00_1139 [Paenibacillus barcinonensis]|uniref:Uncharacterized protein n=1 Tax=Paenibacillus barcinonensis TaxID=198119 RepID=A0A2V4VZ80_PAEBA|nr:hypothetical protein DFQ00_1139 [Paenibacillus barcinonensis]
MFLAKGIKDHIESLYACIEGLNQVGAVTFDMFVLVLQDERIFNIKYSFLQKHQIHYRQ